MLEKLSTLSCVSSIPLTKPQSFLQRRSRVDMQDQLCLWPKDGKPNQKPKSWNNLSPETQRTVSSVLTKPISRATCPRPEEQIRALVTRSKPCICSDMPMFRCVGPPQPRSGSTDRQYKLKERALRLDWPETSTKIIDEDLALSAPGTSDRHGFATMITEVALGNVGVVLSIEVSRIARIKR